MRNALIFGLLALSSPSFAASTSTYAVVTTAPQTVPDPACQADPCGTIVLPTGTVVNLIEWDGVTAYSPGPGLRLTPAGTLRIGDISP